eukprot:4196742-Amphidinium_carterae.1
MVQGPIIVLQGLLAPACCLRQEEGIRERIQGTSKTKVKITKPVDMEQGELSCSIFGKLGL